MSGICGVAFEDRGRQVGARDLAPMLRALQFAASDAPGDLDALSVGHAAVGTRATHDGLAGVASTTRGGCLVALAFHGNLYGRDGPVADPIAGLLARLADEGTDPLVRLRGEFALALWDGRTATLHLATDRFRIHPLLYAVDAEKIVFASRMKAILACPYHVKRSVDLSAVVDIVGSSIVATPKTIFREVKKLPPAHVLSWRQGSIDVRSYWDLDFLEPERASRRDLEARLRTHVEDAISVRLHGDGTPHRIGAFLSGGIDSSTVTGVLSHVAGTSVKSFSIGFAETPYNELNYARIAAQAFGSDHHERIVTAADTLDALPVLVDAYDEPFANASAVPSYFCAKMAREHGVDVLYAGDGGDELFAGNERYGTERFFDYWQDVPAWLREPLVRPAVFALADWLRLGTLIKAKKYIERASIPYPERLSSYGFFRLVSLSDVFDDGVMAAIGDDYDPYEALARHYRAARARTELDRQLFVDLKLTISDNDILKVNRAAAAAGVATRYPLLDGPLVEFAASVPAALKMRGTKLRTFFKSAYADFLPAATRAKRKHGFGLPISAWLRNDPRLNELMRDLVLGRASLDRGYFRKKAIVDLVERHRADTTSFYGTILWNLMMIELWHRGPTVTS